MRTVYLHGDDGDGEDGGVHPAKRAECGQAVTVCVVLTSAEDGVNDSAAVAGTAAVGLGDVDKTADEGNVEGDGDEGRHGVAGETAEQKEAQRRVYDADT